MHILLTRPKYSAELTAIKLQAMGHSVESAPVLDIVTLPQQINSDAADIVVFTSQNAVMALEELSPGWLANFKGSAFAVGERTAAMVENAGFAGVYIGTGDVGGLAELVTKTKPEGKQKVYFPRGRHVRGNLEAELKQSGFEVESQILYEACPTEDLPSGVLKGLKEAKFDRALFYSARSATTFIKLAKKANIDSLNNTVAVALSTAIAEDLKAINWAGVKVAAEKSETSLISSL